jgi:hypothetical protein
MFIDLEIVRARVMMSLEDPESALACVDSKKVLSVTTSGKARVPHHTPRHTFRTTTRLSIAKNI